MYLSIKYGKKTYTSFITVCFAAMELVIVLTWFSVTSASRYHPQYQSRSPMYNPWSDSTEFRGIGRGSSD